MLVIFVLKAPTFLFSTEWQSQGGQHSQETELCTNYRFSFIT